MKRIIQFFKDNWGWYVLLAIIGLFIWYVKFDPIPALETYIFSVFFFTLGFLVKPARDILTDESKYEEVTRSGGNTKNQFSWGGFLYYLKYFLFVPVLLYLLWELYNYILYLIG